MRPTTLSAAFDVFSALGLGEMREQQRQLDVALGGERRQQIVELEHEPDVPRAPGGELAVGELVDAIAADLHGAVVGRSRPPIRLSSVDLPEPDGPISARNSPSFTSRLRPESTWISSEPRRKSFRDVADVDQAGRCGWRSLIGIFSVTAAPSARVDGGLTTTFSPAVSPAADRGFDRRDVARRSPRGARPCRRARPRRCRDRHRSATASFGTISDFAVGWPSRFSAL